MLTEDQARKTWCPMTRVIFMEDGNIPADQTSWNRLQPNVQKTSVKTGPTVSCLASQCAMWRWSNLKADGADTGFCGLAGIPL